MVKKVNDQDQLQAQVRPQFGPHWQQKGYFDDAIDSMKNTAQWTYNTAASIGDNIRAVGRNAVQGPATFVKGFAQVGGGFGKVATGLNKFGQFSFYDGASLLKDGMSQIPRGSLNMGVGAVMTTAGFTPIIAGLTGLGYAYKKGKNSFLYKLYKQRKQKKAKQTLSDFANRILTTTASDKFQKQYLPRVNKIVDYAEAKVSSGIQNINDLGGKVSQAIDSSLGTMEQQARHWGNKGVQNLGGMLKEKLRIQDRGNKKQGQKKPGILINVDQKGPNPPRHLDVINHKNQIAISNVLMNV